MIAIDSRIEKELLEEANELQRAKEMHGKPSGGYPEWLQGQLDEFDMLMDILGYVTVIEAEPVEEDDGFWYRPARLERKDDGR